MLKDETKAVIKEMRRKAEAPVAILTLSDVIDQRLADLSLFEELEVGGQQWWVGYGLEQQPGGLSRHLSVSHPDRKTLPDFRSEMALLHEFEFDLTRSVVRAVLFYPGRGKTLHLLQLLRST